jgi:hypothetical protein
MYLISDVWEFDSALVDGMNEKMTVLGSFGVHFAADLFSELLGLVDFFLEE